MYFSNNSYRLARLTYDRLQTGAKLLAEEFMSANVVWMTIKPTMEEVRRFMYDKAKQMLDWEEELRQEGTIGKETFLNVVYLNSEDEIVGVIVSFDLEQYLRKKSKVYLAQFETLEHYGEELEKSINPKDVVPGLNIYSMFGTISSEFTGAGVAILFWLDYGHYLHTQGYRFMYGRTSNIKSFQLMTKNGGEKLTKIKVMQNGKLLTLGFVRFPLDPLHAIMFRVRNLVEKAKL